MLLDFNGFFSADALDTHQHLQKDIPDIKRGRFRRDGAKGFVGDAMVSIRTGETAFQTIKSPGTDLGFGDDCQRAVLRN